MPRLPLIILAFLSFTTARAQTKPVKIAIFAPVYLDSVFAGDTYKLNKGANLPRYILPGLDFYNGAMMAVDSLNKEKAQVEVLFFDSKAEGGIEQQITDTLMQDVSLIIASFSNRDEIKPLADFALSKKIVLISATYPNDGGTTTNPSFVLLNPTLTAHIEGLYKYVRKYYPLQTITWFRKNGDTEDMIEKIFSEQNKKTGGTQLKLKTVSLSDSFTAHEVLSYLDSNHQNTIICGSLNEIFGSNLSKALGSNKNFRITAVGMPTWDGIRDISKDLEIIYSTPYNFQRTEKLGLILTDKYKNKYSGRATDMVFKGFESMYHFTKLLLKYGNALPSHLSDKEFKLFNDFDIQPVKLSTNSALDYFENRKLYFIRKKDGMVRPIN
jgi:hypothetical protein